MMEARWGFAAMVLPRGRPILAPSSRHVEGMAQVLAPKGLARKPLPRSTPGRVVAFFCVMAASLVFTLVGWTLFLGQVASEQDTGNLFVTVVLQSGLVVLGPLVLWAYLALMPRGLPAAILRRLRRPFDF